MERPREPRGAPAGLRIAGLALLAGLGGTSMPACCLVRPPDAKILIEAGENGLRTPESAFETYRVAFGADLPEFEYRCLSADFRRENGISYQTYRVARQQMLESQPYLAFLAKAKVLESTELKAGRHRLLVEAAGRRFVVDLVREDEFKMYAGDVLLADGLADFERAVRVRQTARGQTVSGEARLDGEEFEAVDLSGLSSLRFERVWKIDRFGDEPDA